MNSWTAETGNGWRKSADGSLRGLLPRRIGHQSSLMTNGKKRMPGISEKAIQAIGNSGPRNWKMLQRIFGLRWILLQWNCVFPKNGQIGIYPEQVPNWKWLKEQTEKADRPFKILNGFAYTGGSTLFASLGGIKGEKTDICHIDASKSAVNWARSNRDLSGLQEQTIRFVVEDILRFMEREIKRGRVYQGIILDPPAFGRAPGGRTWVLKKDLATLIDLSIRLMDEDPRFFLLSCHDPEITKEILAGQIAKLPGITPDKVETLDLMIPSEKGNSLPNGIAARWSNS